MGASQFLARLRQESGILLRRLWNGKLWHYGLRWQSEAATPLWIRRLTCHRSRILPSHDAAKAVSPLRSVTAVHITRPLSIESEMCLVDIVRANFAPHTAKVSLVNNPALEAFVAQVGDEFVLAQLLIRRINAGFELRNVADRDTNNLKEVNDLKQMRELAQFTARGDFRPLKSAPNLAREWRMQARDAEELGLALNYLYPGAVADWFAVRSGRAAATNYRGFTARQTGMYRITAMLPDELAANATRACCDLKFCLKQRLWAVPRLPTDDEKDKSAIPCLEPCAIMLEFARKVMRMEQEEKTTLSLSGSERETLIAALQRAREDSRSSSLPVREADFAHELNPRRVELLLNRLKSGMVKDG